MTIERWTLQSLGELWEIGLNLLGKVSCLKSILGPYSLVDILLLTITCLLIPVCSVAETSEKFADGAERVLDCNAW